MTLINERNRDGEHKYNKYTHTHTYFFYYQWSDNNRESSGSDKPVLFSSFPDQTHGKTGWSGISAHIHWE